MNDSAQNLKEIEARLAPVKAMPDGVLYHNPNSDNDILVQKTDGILYLYFHAALDAEIQSRMEIDAPLHLLSPYSQMVMLSLMWQSAPKRVYIIGFGGGRIPMVMHHMLPSTQIDCAEIDGEVVDVAMRFFGIGTDARLRITVADGRKTLADHSAREPYDIIVVDAFVGLGSGPRSFATCEFFALCRERLTPGGVVVINLLDNDPANAQKRLTIIESFPLVMGIRDDERGNQVLFGCNSTGISREEVIARAQTLQEGLGFSFSLPGLAERLRVLSNPAKLFTGPAPELLHDLHPAAPHAPKAGRNDLCPCGSTKKYKKCCGN